MFIPAFIIRGVSRHRIYYQVLLSEAQVRIKYIYTKFSLRILHVLSQVLTNRTTKFLESGRSHPFLSTRAKNYYYPHLHSSESLHVMHLHDATSPIVNMHASSLLAIMLGLAASSTALSTQVANRRLRRDPPPTTPTVGETIPPALAPIPSVSTSGSLMQNPRAGIQLPKWSAPSPPLLPLGALPPPQPPD